MAKTILRTNRKAFSLYVSERKGNVAPFFISIARKTSKIHWNFQFVGTSLSNVISLVEEAHRDNTEFILSIRYSIYILIRNKLVDLI